MLHCLDAFGVGTLLKSHLDNVLAHLLKGRIVGYGNDLHLASTR